MAKLQPVRSSHGEKAKVREGDGPTQRSQASGCVLPVLCSSPQPQTCRELPRPLHLLWVVPGPSASSLGPTVQRDFPSGAA